MSIEMNNLEIMFHNQASKARREIISSRFNSIFSLGRGVALGMAWHLDNGFWHIFLDAFLGWIYVAFKLTQYLWPF